MKNNKGITLIALVITIVVLIILAGVAINLTLGENGILKKAEYAREEYKLAQSKEKLELEILEVQTKIMDEQSRVATLEDLLSLIDVSKYEMVLKYEPLASSEIIQTKATYAEIIEIETQIKFTVDKKLVITSVNVGEVREKFEIEIKEENGVYFTIDASKAVQNGEEVKTYKYYINDEMVGESEQDTYVATNLNTNTEYKIYVVTVDSNSNDKTSKVITYKTSDKVYLYNSQNEYNQITGGWNIFAKVDYLDQDIKATQLNLIRNSEYIFAQCDATNTSNKYDGGCILMTNKIDLSKYSKINIRFTANLSKYSSSSAIEFCIDNDQEIVTDIQRLCYTSAVNNKTVEIDISNNNEVARLGCYLQAQKGYEAEITIYEVWLEQ